MENQNMTLEKLGEGIDAINKKLGGFDEQFGSIDKQFKSIDKRFESIDKRFESMDQRLDRMEDNTNKRFDKLTASVGSLEIDMVGVKAELSHMNVRYDETFEKLDVFLGRSTDQEEVDSPEFR